MSYLVSHKISNVLNTKNLTKFNTIKCKMLNLCASLNYQDIIPILRSADIITIRFLTRSNGGTSGDSALIEGKYRRSILTSRCRCSCYCSDDWQTPVCASVIDLARALRCTVAWICPLAGPFSSVSDLSRTRSPLGSRKPLEANLGTSWSISVAPNTPVNRVSQFVNC